MFDKWFKKKEEKLEAVESIKEIPVAESVDTPRDLKMTVEELKTVEEIKKETVEEVTSPVTAVAEIKEKDKNVCKIVTQEFELRQKSLPTSIEECDQIGLWDKLRATLLDRETGLALTANQIGIMKRAFLVCLREGDKVTKEIKFVNPVIMEEKAPVRFDGEGCLSYPEKFINTARYGYLKVKDDVNGERVYKDFMAIILQHEIDHLEGVLFFDRALPAPFKRVGKKIGRNDACTCGSGKKYKKCCLK